MNFSLDTVMEIIKCFTRKPVGSVGVKRTPQGTIYVVDSGATYTTKEIHQMYKALQTTGALQKVSSKHKVSRHVLNINQASMTKKGNMAYWDSIDDLAETFVEQFLACACVNNPKALQYQVDTTTLGKEVVEFLLGQLQEEGLDTDKLYPYVNENY